MPATRGERLFLRFPRFAATLYDRLMAAAPIRQQFREMAEQIAARFETGRLLDVGTGPGYLLFELNGLNPRIELYGLDISASMIARARRNLSGTAAALCQGSIRHTDYPDAFFHAVICSGSFYLWDEPEPCLSEIYRILGPGGFACFFEPHREFPRRELRRLLQERLRNESWLLRIMGPFGLRMAMRMTYDVDQYATIFQKSPFADNFSLARIALAQLPIWLRITLFKPA